jgi:predicted RNA-binding Zn-ribbon protein involved in translation (DUF1610 family)
MEHFRVATKLTCPDCGGVLGPAEPGESSCTCFQSQSFSQPTTGEESLSDTQPVETLTKVCCKCGTDVAGKKRYKDSRGYICADCNRKEIEEEKAGTELCPNCGRRVKEAALTEFRGMRICKLCIAELKASDSKKIKVISGKQFDANDRRTLKILVIICVVLLFFMVLGFFKARG